jgi:hypothetical protein
MTESDFISAIQKAVQKAPSESELARSRGLKPGVINRLKNKKTSILNTTVGVVWRIFPDMEIDFFGGLDSSETTTEILTEILNFLRKLSKEERERALQILQLAFPESK